MSIAQRILFFNDKISKNDICGSRLPSLSPLSGAAAPALPCRSAGRAKKYGLPRRLRLLAMTALRAVGGGRPYGAPTEFRFLKTKTQSPKLKTQNPRLKTQNSKLKTSFVPDGEKRRGRRWAFVAACRTCFFLLLFRADCRIMPHEQEIFKPRYRETGKIAHNGRVWGESASGPLRVLPEAAGHFFLSRGGEP